MIVYCLYFKPNQTKGILGVGNQENISSRKSREYRKKETKKIWGVETKRIQGVENQENIESRKPREYREQETKRI